MKKIMIRFLPTFGMTIIAFHTHFANGISYSEENWLDKIILNINIHLANYLSAVTFIYKQTNKFLCFYNPSLA
jgi:hypothetical protein